MTNDIELMMERNISQQYKNLLRETLMRCRLSFPQDEQDIKWFEEGTDIAKSGNYFERVYIFLDKDI